LRTFVNFDRQTETSGGAVIFSDFNPGMGMDTKLSGFVQVNYVQDRIRTAGGTLVGRKQFAFYTNFGVARWLPQLGVNGNVGQDVDFDNSRPGTGWSINATATANPTQHLELAIVLNAQSLHVRDTASGLSGRLFLARVSRVGATYIFTSRCFVRVIGQYVSTDSNPALYLQATPPRSGSFSASALLAYKINWQSVMYAGYGDDRNLSDAGRLQPADRQVFVKLSYAFQK
jgi:hypothetical protein